MKSIGVSLGLNIFGPTGNEEGPGGVFHELRGTGMILKTHNWNRFF
jgi:hypothetical protein